MRVTNPAHEYDAVGPILGLLGVFKAPQRDATMLISQLYRAAWVSSRQAGRQLPILMGHTRTTC